MANMQNKTKVITGVNSRFSYFHGLGACILLMVVQKSTAYPSLFQRMTRKPLMPSMQQLMLPLRKVSQSLVVRNPNKAAIKLPLRDGDVERDDEAYKGHYFINANSKKTAPQIVDKSVKPIMDRSEVYSGCYGRVSLNFYAFQLKW